MRSIFGLRTGRGLPSHALGDGGARHLSAFAATFFTLFLLSTATSLAAGPPETPLTSSPAKSITATTAILEGTLNPGASATAGWYFAYSTEISCALGAATPLEAEVTGKAVKEHIEVTGLEPSRKYTFCMVATSEQGAAATPGNEVTFETKPAPPEILSESATNVKPTEARLEGTVNPNNQLTECHFQYGKEALSLHVENTLPCEPELLKGFGGQGVGVNVGGLEAENAYHYRIVAKNGKGEETIGAEQEFKRVASPPEAPETTVAENPANTTVTLHGVVNPSAPSVASWFFEYNKGASCTGAGALATPAQGPEEVQARPTEAAVTGLQPGTQYTFCLVAENEAKVKTLGAGVSFTTAALPPAISAETVSAVGSESATLSAHIETHGEALTYYFEYGPGETYSSSTPPTTLAAGQGNVAVQALLTDTLAPETTYRYRLVVSNAAHQTADGTDQSFTTYPLAQPPLPDDRGYELVSPANAGDDEAFEPALHGIQPPDGNDTEIPFRAAVDGDAFAYPAGSSVTGGSGLYGTGGGNEYLSIRGASGGWSAQNIEPSSPSKREVGFYEGFSPNLEVGILDWDGEVPLTPGAPSGGNGLQEGYNALYTRSDESGALHPLFSAPPPGLTVNQFATTQVHEDRGGSGARSSGLAYAGSSEGMTHVLFEAPGALTPQAQADPGIENSEGKYREYNLYDFVEGTLYSVNILPGYTSSTPHASYGAPISADNQYQQHPDFDHVISANGSRVFWSTVEIAQFELTETVNREAEAPKALYLRENDTAPQSPFGPGGECTVAADACTLQLDTPQPGATGAAGGGQFWAASADGSKAFFTDCNRLTTDSTAVATEGCFNLNNREASFATFTGNDLYEYQVNPEAGKPGRLTDLTVDPHFAEDGETADVQGVLGTSENGEYIYFVASGALAPGASPQDCNYLDLTGKCNLYVVHDGGAPQFIAALSTLDDKTLPNADNLQSDWQPDLGLRTAEATPDGSHLVFSSAARLTSYDNEGYAEVYVYDAAANDGEGALHCASCDPAGAPPANPQTFGEEFPYEKWSAFLQASDNLTYQHRWISADGTKVFFDSGEALVPRDKNGKVDVYEWEQEGTGSCTKAVAYNGGCISLLSGGTSEANSFFLDASESGDDAFFETRSPLLQAGQGERLDIYDARAGAAQPLAPVACSGSGCQGTPPPPPVFATPSSVTFNGVGNFSSPSLASAEGLVRTKPKPKPKGCKKGFVKKKTRCVRKHKSKKSKQTNRRAGR